MIVTMTLQLWSVRQNVSSSRFVQPLSPCSPTGRTPFPSVLYPSWTAQLKWWMDSDTQTPESVLSGAQSPAVNVILWQESQIHTNIHRCITSWFQSSNFVFSDNAWENWVRSEINITGKSHSYAWLILDGEAVRVKAMATEVVWSALLNASRAPFILTLLPPLIPPWLHYLWKHWSSLQRPCREVKSYQS